MSGFWSLLGYSSAQELCDSAKFSVIKNITITEIEIGRGSYGVIYKAIYGGKECVAKEIHHNLIVEDFNTVVGSFVKEIDILSTLRHPSIVHFLGVHFKEGLDVPILIMEKMWMNLTTLLSEKQSIPLVIKVGILKDVACGLKYLHSQEPPVIHRDLTANNILLNKNLDAKIADLGLSKAVEAIARQRMSTALGTLACMPPESLQRNPVYTANLDMFSFGCVIVHTVTQEFPTPTDLYESSEVNKNDFLKISELNRRKKYVDKMSEQYPSLTYLATACLKDSPEHRPNAETVHKWFEEYWKKRGTEESQLKALFDCYQLDRYSLISSLDSQSTKAEELQTTVELFRSEVQKLTHSTLSKDEKISSLQKRNNDQQVSIQSQQSEIDQLKSQCEKLSQQSNSEIVMNLSSMLRQEQEDMKEKQEEIKNLKIKLNNLEKSYTKLKRENEEAEHKIQQDDKLHSKKEAEFIQNIEVLSNEKKELCSQVQNYVADLQNMQKEVKELKGELQKTEHINKTIEITSVDKQPEAVENDELTTNDSVFPNEERKLQDQMQSMSAQVMQVQKENEELKSKLEQKEKEHHQFKEEVKEKLEFWKIKAETLTNKDAANELEAEKQKVDQEKEKLKQQLKAANELSNKCLTEFNKNVMEKQIASESYDQRVRQMHQCLTSLEKQRKEISELKQKLSNAKSISRLQLDEKSLRLSLMLPQLNACQQRLEVKDKELGDMQLQNENLQNLLEKVSKLHTTAQQELENYKVAYKEEAKLSQEVKFNSDVLLPADLQKCVREKEKEVTVLNETLQKYHEAKLQLQDKIKNLEKQIKSLTASYSKSSRQLESKLKEKSKFIETLEKKSSTGHYSHYHYSLHWSPYLSLPVRRIKPTAAVVKDKVFVTGGYQNVCPQGRELNSYLKFLERGNEVFCFHTTKCRCYSIASPVVLGGVASVNGQCVLVSGAEGNTLTGNVYVLCEEGSDEQWKKFSEPVPTPRILPCVCCYDERWMIVCGGCACKEGSNLLEAVNAVEILDTAKGEWYTLPEAGSPNLSTILACSVIGDDVYIIGDVKVLKSSCNNLVMAESDNIVWAELSAVLNEEDEDFHPFSVVDVNGEPMIIASISGSEDDMTCVLMKDTTDTWRKMSETVECQHCSAVVVTPTLELLLFGGSGNVQLAEGTDVCRNGTLIPVLNIWENTPQKIPIVITQPPAVSFTGPIHSQQFDHKGGTFQSPVHKVSIVVPSNAIDDGENITIHMGATTNGPFDLPEDCKLRSAVVWLGSASEVVLKRSIAVVVPHSAVFISPQHHSMMRFLTCEDCEGPRYKFQRSKSKFEIAPGYGVITIQKLAMVAIVSQSESIVANGSVEENVDNKLIDVPACYTAKLFWPLKSLPVSFKADVFCVQDIPTELYKVDTLCRKAYYKENVTHPEVVGTKLIIYGKKLKCVLPCDSSKECDCLTGWDVTPLSDVSELEENIGHYKIDSVKFSYKFNCCYPSAHLLCCFQFLGASRKETCTMPENVPKCLQSRFAKLGTYPPILLQSGVNTTTKDTGSSAGSHDQ
ncbi:serine/threonine-protein kinase TAO3-like isoform X2 [Dysidea avara]